MAAVPSDQSGSKPDNMVEASQLSIEQLNQLLKQLDEEIQFFSESCQTIKSIQQRFQESLESVKKLSKAPSESEIMVPLTSAMYVPGKLSSVETVLIELGTGYYADMPLAQAEAFFSRKVAYVTKQLENLQNLAHEKLKMKAAVTEVFQAKIGAQLNMQQRPTGKA